MQRPDMRRNRLTALLDMQYPLIQGPYGGGLSTVELLVSVSEAGGLGSFGANNLDGPSIAQLVDTIRARTRKAFAINLWVPGPQSDTSPAELARAIERMGRWYDLLGIEPPGVPSSCAGPAFEQQIEALLEVRPPVFSFVFGVPATHVLDKCRAHGIATIGTATTVAEAIILDRAGVDAIVASGFEAGGHRGSFLRPAEESLIGTLALVPQVVDSVTAPVIAAGGIADARGVAAALMLGAQGAQIGTAFLACAEANLPQPHRQAILSVPVKETVLTKAFSGRLARSVRNGLSDACAAGDLPLLPYPAQAWLINTMRSAAVSQDRDDLLSLSCGQAAGLVQGTSARELVGSIVSGLQELLT
ncbi:nitronate monooxygenase [Enhydrobacter aerosaccus]|nr:MULTISPECIES: nitronate monooxygenase [Alphaproteobacteria]SJZ61074.1 nitronate monooxygenase [Enhydrobacter aerosaccus]